MWQTVEAVAKGDAVVTGNPTGTEESAPSPFASLDKPVLAFVADPTIALADFDQLEEVVFKNEKIGLAMKAFRAVRIHPDHAANDPILAGEGKTVPRILVVDPVKEDVQVIEESKIKVSTLYKAMKTVADRFYKEKLDKIVKEHLKLLNDRDKLAGEDKCLREKEGRLLEDGEKAAKELEKVRKEIADLAKEIDALNEQEKGLWHLTPREKAA